MILFSQRGSLEAAITQSLLLLAIQHGYAMTQPKTRRELKGPFFKDYFDSLSNLGGWEDGGRFFTNYIAHPLQGAASGFIQIQNDPKGIRQQFGGSKRYWTSRLKAMGWSAAMSTQFELGPISQASIGNVGKARKLTYVDLVVTPTVGAALIVGEDMLDRFVVRWSNTNEQPLSAHAARMLLNPSRSCANMLRFKKPWHRDTVGNPACAGESHPVRCRGSSNNTQQFGGTHMSVARVTEISSTSEKSFEDAMQMGIARAVKTLRNVKSAWIKEQQVKIEGEKVVSYQVNMLITFVLDETSPVE